MSTLNKANLKHNTTLFELLNRDFKEVSKNVHMVEGKWKHLPDLLSQTLMSIDLKDFRKTPELMRFIHDGNFIINSINPKKLNIFKKIIYNFFLKKYLNNQI